MERKIKKVLTSDEWHLKKWKWGCTKSFSSCVFDILSLILTDMITDTQIEMGLLKAELKEMITYTLLRKHRHQTKKSNLRSLADIGRTVSSASRLFSNQENGKVYCYTKLL